VRLLLRNGCIEVPLGPPQPFMQRVGPPGCTPVLLSLVAMPASGINHGMRHAFGALELAAGRLGLLPGSAKLLLADLGRTLLMVTVDVLILLILTCLSIFRVGVRTSVARPHVSAGCLIAVVAVHVVAVAIAQVIDIIRHRLHRPSGHLRPRGGPPMLAAAACHARRRRCTVGQGIPHPRADVSRDRLEAVLVRDGRTSWSLLAAVPTLGLAGLAAHGPGARRRGRGLCGATAAEKGAVPVGTARAEVLVDTSRRQGRARRAPWPATAAATRCAPGPLWARGSALEAPHRPCPAGVGTTAAAPPVSWPCHPAGAAARWPRLQSPRLHKASAACATAASACRGTARCRLRARGLLRQDGQLALDVGEAVRIASAASWTTAALCMGSRCAASTTKPRLAARRHTAPFLGRVMAAKQLARRRNAQKCAGGTPLAAEPPVPGRLARPLRRGGLLRRAAGRGRHGQAADGTSAEGEDQVAGRVNATTLRWADPGWRSPHARAAPAPNGANGPPDPAPR
jgi:hypothetical protein